MAPDDEENRPLDSVHAWTPDDELDAQHAAERRRLLDLKFASENQPRLRPRPQLPLQNTSIDPAELERREP